MVTGEERAEDHVVYVAARAPEDLEPFRRLAVGDDWTWGEES